MASVSDIAAFLSRMAPLELAESYDNVGLLAGDGEREVKKALVALDITRPVCEEAARKGAELVVSHHPVIFKPVSSVVRQGKTGVLWELMGRNLSAVCMHTNLDIARGGVNDVLAESLGLTKTGILQVTGSYRYRKVVVFVPQTHAADVRAAMARAGAGRYGNYTGCAFETNGKGYFRPLEGARPFIGKQGETSQADEVRIEAIVRQSDLDAVLKAVRSAHPYEEPAFDVFDDEAITEPYGIGMTALPDQERTLEDFARVVNIRLSAGGVRIADAGKPVRKLAVCSGSWDDDLTMPAENAGADTILTGEIKHSSLLLALSCGLNVVAAGHFATENVICPVLASRLGEAFPGILFEVAKSNRNPSRLIH